jgi:hypothetical protein
MQHSVPQKATQPPTPLAPLSTNTLQRPNSEGNMVPEVPKL